MKLEGGCYCRALRYEADPGQFKRSFHRVPEGVVPFDRLPG